MRNLRFVVLPLVVVACSGDDTVVGDAGPEGGKDATTDAAKDAGADAAKDATVDATDASDATVDAADASDATVDADDASDATIDVVSDVAVDAPVDTGVDAPVDTGVDAPVDAPFEAAVDASDASTDASMDADAADGGSMWNTPTCDGMVSASEYGGAQNVTTSGGQTWYVTWDATNLYVGLDAANLGEANVVYVGFSGNGYQNAQPYDGTGGTLNFLADGVVYAKSGYNETRIASNTAWGNAAANSIMFCSNGQTREEVIPWSTLGASAIPSAFRFMGYATSGGGFVYAQIPTSLPSGQVGTSANWNHDFFVASTNNGSGSFPFDTTE